MLPCAPRLVPQVTRAPRALAAEHHVSRPRKMPNGKYPRFYSTARGSITTAVEIRQVIELKVTLTVSYESLENQNALMLQKIKAEKTKQTEVRRNTVGVFKHSGHNERCKGCWFLIGHCFDLWVPFLSQKHTIELFDVPPVLSIPLTWSSRIAYYFHTSPQTMPYVSQT